MFAFEYRKPMQPVMIRLPQEVRNKARVLIDEAKKRGERIDESKVYRSIITSYFDLNLTDSKNQEGGDIPQQAAPESE